MAEVKTNAMRMLDRAKIPYRVHMYDHADGKIDGVSVATWVKTGDMKNPIDPARAKRFMDEIRRARELRV